MLIERDVDFQVFRQKVVGTLCLPETQVPAPVVLLLHGFTGSRHEMAIAGTSEYVFSRTARLLAEAGFASLRIDFRGSGESEGLWVDTTYSGQSADAVAAIDWLSACPDIDHGQISVLGWSQGGLVACHAARSRPQVKSLILWAPVVNPMLTFSFLLGSDTVLQALKQPAETLVTAQLPWGGEVKLNASYVHEMPRTDPVAALACYPGPVQVIVGLHDEAVFPQPSSGEVLLAYHQGPHQLDIFEMDHSFGCSFGPKTLDGKMLPTTIAWLRRWSSVA
jgi:uncharacterized protein